MILLPLLLFVVLLIKLLLLKRVLPHILNKPVVATLIAVSLAMVEAFPVEEIPHILNNLGKREVRVVTGSSLRVKVDFNRARADFSPVNKKAVVELIRQAHKFANQVDSDLVPQERPVVGHVQAASVLVPKAVVFHAVAEFLAA
jgi:hypothetical protein